MWSPVLVCRREKAQTPCRLTPTGGLVVNAIPYGVSLATTTTTLTTTTTPAAAAVRAAQTERWASIAAFIGVRRL